jgi:fibro-slime domain-containing protein
MAMLAAAIIAALGSGAVAESLELTGTLRDFKDAHPDMEYAQKSFGLRQGIVKANLGEDKKPVFNTSYKNGNYGYAMIKSKTTFDQWFRNVDGVNKSVPYTIVLQDTDSDGIFRYQRSKHNGKSFFPLDGQLYGNQGRSHNYHFTYEIHTKFTYSDPAERDYTMTFQFSGDDDVWVYVNNKLVVDLGGVHSEEFGSVNLDSLASQLGLEPGKSYDFNFFFAERHTTESNFTLETTIQFLSPLYD